MLISLQYLLNVIKKAHKAIT